MKRLLRRAGGVAFAIQANPSVTGMAIVRRPKGPLGFREPAQSEGEEVPNQDTQAPAAETHVAAISNGSGSSRSSDSSPDRFAAQPENQ